MLFNSWVFAIFLVVILTIYHFSRHRIQNLALLVFSYVFYGWWDYRFLSLLLISTVVDYYCGNSIQNSQDQKKKKAFLLVSLIVNLGILSFFKYFNFFSDSFRVLSAQFGLQAGFPVLEILLPVGISFYTFQSMAYTIDIYRGKENASRNILDFALYVSYFPQLVAGPIERSTHLLPQISQPRLILPSHIRTGSQLILLGYLKKILIADSVAPVVAQIFDNPGNYGATELILGVYLFALQIYGDFSGYTDIARGVSRLFGIDLRINFKQPYLSASITEFWRRWHISLSFYLRDYLYIPLGGNRKGKWKTYRNLMITMLLGGLWHGASWNFVVWGGLHGVFLSIHKYFTAEKKIGIEDFPSSLKERTIWLFKCILTFNLVCLAWVFFRAETTADSFSYLTNIVTHWNMIGSAQLFKEASILLVALGGLAVLVDFLCLKNDSESPFNPEWPAWIRGIIYALLVAVLVLVGENSQQTFIYFQF